MTKTNQFNTENPNRTENVGGKNAVLSILKRFEEKGGFEREFESTISSNPGIWCSKNVIMFAVKVTAIS